MNPLRSSPHSQSPSPILFLYFIISIAALCLNLNTQASDPVSGVEGISLSDPKLQVELIDSHLDEFFLCHDMDLQGRLFMGSREGVFAYDRTENGDSNRESSAASRKIRGSMTSSLSAMIYSF